MNLDSVAVIIINYKTAHLMSGLLASIQETGVDVSVVIVDNATNAASYQELAQIKDSRVHLLKSEENLGFTGGINIALQYIQQLNQDINYFFLLNPDAFSCPDLITRLKNLLQQHPQAACISPKIDAMDGKPWYNGAQINYRKGIVTQSLKNANRVGTDCYEVDVFSGCAALFDLKKVANTGPFNEQLFMYYDEADFSLKLKKHGYKILFTPTIKIDHDVSYTTRKISFLKTYYMTRNKFFVFNDSMHLTDKVYFLLHELAFHLKNRRFKNAWYHLKGYIHFKAGKRGQLV